MKRKVIKIDVTKYAESQYVKVDLVRESPSKQITFLSAGKEVETKYGTRLEFQVSMDKKIKCYSPNMQSVKNLKDAWGSDSNMWLTKIAKLTIELTEQGKETIIAVPSHTEESIEGN